ncbi:LLM class flavin-dependent oxidoreductase [Tessaracoccus terricola]
MSLPVSILDRANAREGQSDGEVLAGVVTRAQRAEALGFHRFWVAEHHGVPGIFGSAPTVLMAALAARTERIRIGTGGVMLPAHQPLVVAEQVATLEALFPGRIDVGLGRSLGFTAAVRKSLRQDADAAERFLEDVRELQGFLGGTAPITAQPQNHARTPLFVLANNKGLELAARAGLGVVLGGPAVLEAGGGEHPGIATYRREFRPSPWAAAPHVVVAVNLAVAETTAAARELLVPESWALVESRTKGEFPPLVSAARVHAVEKSERLAEGIAAAVHGTPGEVRQRLETILAATGADELLATGGMFDAEAQLRSDELLMAALG